MGNTFKSPVILPSQMIIRVGLQSSFSFSLKCTGNQSVKKTYIVTIIVQKQYHRCAFSTDKSVSFFSAQTSQGQQRSGEEWKVRVYPRRKKKKRTLSASGGIVQLSGYINRLFFFPFPPFSSQTKASCWESFSRIVSGSCRQCVSARAQRVWPAWDGNPDQLSQSEKSSWTVGHEHFHSKRGRTQRGEKSGGDKCSECVVMGWREKVRERKSGR